MEKVYQYPVDAREDMICREVLLGSMELRRRRTSGEGGFAGKAIIRYISSLKTVFFDSYSRKIRKHYFRFKMH